MTEAAFRKVESMRVARLTIECATAALLFIAASNLRIVTAAPPIAEPQTQSSSARNRENVDEARFEAASIRLNRSGDAGGRMATLQPGRFSAENMPLRALVLHAYGLREAQLIGGPPWMKSDAFDISAKAEGEVSQEERLAMLRNLLKERFGLVLRRETQEMPVYVLSRSRKDGRLGPQLRASSVNCDALPCTSSVNPGGMMMRGKPITHFVEATSDWLQKVVMDRSGLSGNFDLDLSWTPFNIVGDSEGLSMLHAIEDQLGLKLEPQKLPVDVFVIARVQHPGDN